MVGCDAAQQGIGVLAVANRIRGGSYVGIKAGANQGLLGRIDQAKLV